MEQFSLLCVAMVFAFGIYNFLALRNYVPIYLKVLGWFSCSILVHLWRCRGQTMADFLQHLHKIVTLFASGLETVLQQLAKHHKAVVLLRHTQNLSFEACLINGMINCRSNIRVHLHPSYTLRYDVFGPKVVITVLKWSPCGNLLFAATNKKDYFIWETKTWRLHAHFETRYQIDDAGFILIFFNLGSYFLGPDTSMEFERRYFVCGLLCQGV